MAKKLLTTPKGVAVFPHLLKPDTRFDPQGVYVTKLRLEGADAKSLSTSLDAAMKQAVLEAKNDPENAKAIKKAGKLKVADRPYGPELDKEDNPTGATLFTFKMKAQGKKKDGEVFYRHPTIFDSAGTPIKDVPRIGGGSIIRVSYEISPFFTAMIGAGISLRLEAVQIVKLVEFGGNASYFGFEDESSTLEDGASVTGPAAETDVPDGEGPANEIEEF